MSYQKDLQALMESAENVIEDTAQKVFDVVVSKGDGKEAGRVARQLAAMFHHLAGNILSQYEGIMAINGGGIGIVDRENLENIGAVTASMMDSRLDQLKIKLLSAGVNLDDLYSQMNRGDITKENLSDIIGSRLDEFAGEGLEVEKTEKAKARDKAKAEVEVEAGQSIH